MPLVIYLVLVSLRKVVPSVLVWKNLFCQEESSPQFHQMPTTSPRYYQHLIRHPSLCKSLSTINQSRNHWNTKILAVDVLRNLVLVVLLVLLLTLDFEGQQVLYSSSETVALTWLNWCLSLVIWSQIGSSGRLLSVISTQTSCKLTTHICDLKAMMSWFGLQQVTTDPNRTTSNSNIPLNYLYTSHLSYISNLSLIPPIGKSDQCYISMNPCLGRP